MHLVVKMFVYKTITAGGGGVLILHISNPNKALLLLFGRPVSSNIVCAT